MSSDAVSALMKEHRTCMDAEVIQELAGWYFAIEIDRDTLKTQLQELQRDYQIIKSYAEKRKEELWALETKHRAAEARINRLEESIEEDRRTRKWTE